MALQATLAKEIHMRQGEFRFPLSVARFTSAFLKLVHRPWVAIHTGEGEAIVADLVPLKGESTLLPAKMLLRNQRQKGVRTIVLRMAVLRATPRLTRRQYPAMQFVGIPQFRCYLSVTIKTAVGHGVCIPRWCVAGATLAGQFLM